MHSRAFFVGVVIVICHTTRFRARRLRNSAMENDGFRRGSSARSNGASIMLAAVM